MAVVHFDAINFTALVNVWKRTSSVERYSKRPVWMKDGYFLALYSYKVIYMSNISHDTSW